MVVAAAGGDLCWRLRAYGALVRAGLRVGCSTRPGGSQKSVHRDLQEANECGARVAVVVGGDECARGVYGVKDLRTGAQTEARPEELVERCLKICGADAEDVEVYKRYIGVILDGEGSDAEKVKVLRESLGE